MSTSLEIVRIPVLSDNYVWLMREPQSGSVGVVDPAVAGPVLAEADKRGWKITHILNTHHHGDHVGGNREIKEATGCTIVGPRRDKARIPGIDVDRRRRRPLPLRRGRGRGVLRSGPYDRAYRLCLQGAARAVLRRHALRPGLRQDVRGHAAAVLALARAPARAARRHAGLLRARIHAVERALRRDHRDRQPAAMARRRRSTPPAPAARRRCRRLLGEEKQTNPFLRADKPSVQKAVGMPGGDPVQVFAEVRHRKDVFR